MRLPFILFLKSLVFLFLSQESTAQVKLTPFLEVQDRFVQRERIGRGTLMPVTRNSAFAVGATVLFKSGLQVQYVLSRPNLRMEAMHGQYTGDATIVHEWLSLTHGIGLGFNASITQNSRLSFMLRNEGNLSSSPNLVTYYINPNEPVKVERSFGNLFAQSLLIHLETRLMDRLNLVYGVSGGYFRAENSRLGLYWFGGVNLGLTYTFEPIKTQVK